MALPSASPRRASSSWFAHFIVHCQRSVFSSAPVPSNCHFATLAVPGPFSFKISCSAPSRALWCRVRGLRSVSSTRPYPTHQRHLAMSAVKRKTSSSATESEAKKMKANGSITSFFGAPKPKPVDASAPAPAVKFDKQKWVDSLTSEQKELLKLEIETLDHSWLAHLKDDIVTKEFLELKKFLDRETAAGKKWFPPKEDIYSWYVALTPRRPRLNRLLTRARSRHTPFNNVKVVIVGQDPYHNVNQAHGMAFSVRPPTPAPPSLKNMYKALKKDYPSFVPPPNNGGLLIPWADRGVLMLNTCLTVRAHEANSHSNRGWERFTQRVIDLVAQKRTRGVVFMAWGTPAGKRVQKVDKSRHLILQSVHPSPLSASRGFFDCGHFKAANEWLIKRYGDDGEIDWALTPSTSTKKAVPLATVDEPNPKTNGASSPVVVPKDEPKDEPKVTLKKDEPKATLKADDDFGSDDEAALEEALKQAEEDAQK